MFGVIPRLSAILLGFVGFVHIIKDTVVESFFRWVWLGSVLDFVYGYYPYLASILILGVLSKWIRSWRVLAVAFGFLLLFFLYLI
jgi:hypothetical protein